MTAQFLRHVPLFSSLSEEQIGALAEVAIVRRYRRGERVVEARQQGDEFFIMRRGRVKVSLIRDDGREIILSFLERGDAFGELSLLDGKPRSANVTALRDTEVVTLRRAVFLDLLHQHPDVAYTLLGELASRLRRTDHQIGCLALGNVTHRITKTLLSLATEHGVRTPEGLVLEHRPTHDDLAKLSGTTRETVTRILGHLEREGYLVNQGRRLVIVAELADQPLDSTRECGGSYPNSMGAHRATEQ